MAIMVLLKVVVPSFIKKMEKNRKNRKKKNIKVVVGIIANALHAQKSFYIL